MSADDRRMQATSYVPQLIKRFGHFSPRALQPLLGSRIIVRLFGKAAEFESQRNQALLSTVVEISFQATTLVLLSFDHPATRTLKLLQTSPKFGFQPAVFQRDAGRGTDRFDQLGLLAECGVVDQCSDLLAVLLDEGDSTTAVMFRQHCRIAVLISPASVLR